MNSRSEDCEGEEDFYTSCHQLETSESWSILTNCHPLTLNDWMAFEFNVTQDFLPKCNKHPDMENEIESCVEQPCGTDCFAAGL